MLSFHLLALLSTTFAPQPMPSALPLALPIMRMARQTPRLRTSSPLSQPRIVSVQRLERSGVWHQVTVIFVGEPSQKLRLRLDWDARVVTEDGRLISSLQKSVQTNTESMGEWKIAIKGYPAGQMRARLTDESGQVRTSPPFDVPWLY